MHPKSVSPQINVMEYGYLDPDQIVWEANDADSLTLYFLGTEGKNGGKLRGYRSIRIPFDPDTSD